MTEGPDTEEVTVESAGVTVEKAFVMDEFPVPAVRFDLRSEREEAIHVRLVDEIPESFPMDHVGFHPEFESENWTAYKDDRVEYRRELDPGESVTTVYGIRTDDPEVGAQFLGEPSLEEVEADAGGLEGVEEVLGADSADAVRDVISGERDELPGLGQAEEDLRAARETKTATAGGDTDGEDGAVTATAEDGPQGVDDEVVAEAVPDEPLADEASGEERRAADDIADDVVVAGPGEDEGDSGETAAAEEGEDVVVAGPADAVGDEAGDEATADAADAGPRETAFDGEPAVEADEDDPSVEPVAGGEPDADAGEPGVAPTSEPGEDAAGSTDDAAGSTDDATAPAADETVAAAGAESVAAALATEIREGRIDDDDLDTLRTELDLNETPTSVDVRLSQLQSQVATLSAYTEALEEFLDENGRGQELLEQVETELDAVKTELTEIGEALATADAERAELREEVDGVAGEVHEVADDVGAVDDEVENVADELAATTDRVDDLAGDVGVAKSELGELDDDVDALADDLDDVGATVDRHDDLLGDAGEDLAALENRVEELTDVQERVDGLEHRIDDLDAVRDDVDAIQADIEELEEFRERINAAFGGAGE